LQGDEFFAKTRNRKQFESPRVHHAARRRCAWDTCG
jgi:hypothetical protein